MSNENPFESPQPSEPRLPDGQKKPFRVLLKIGLGTIATSVVLWLIGVGITIFGMTRTMNEISRTEKISPEEMSVMIANMMSIAMPFSASGMILGVLGVILIIIAVVGMLFFKKPITSPK